MPYVLRAFLSVALFAVCMTGPGLAEGGPQGLDLTGRTLTDIAAQMGQGHLTSAQITQWYLDRIKQLDRVGPKLQAVIALNPNALNDARTLDEERRAGRLRGPLHGVPVLIKDNIETADPVATTAGSLALAQNITHRDAPLVAKLRAAGAVILGKTNLSEWANYRSDNPTSGWSGVGGLTRNPFCLDRSTSGSSSGSAAAVAASLATAAIGSETDGSVTSPASTTGIVGFKPTLGLVSRTHIVPISHSQDTAGPMGRSVRDVALLLTVMAGSDPADPATQDADQHKSDFAAALSPDALRGKRIGVMRFESGFNPATDAVFARALDVLLNAGAELVDIDSLPAAKLVPGFERIVLSTEFKADVNTYLGSTPQTVTARTLTELIAFNLSRPARELGLFGQELFLKSEATKGLDDPVYMNALTTSRRLARQEGIDQMLTQYHLDGLVAPTGGPAWIVDTVTGDNALGNTPTLPAVAGYPHLSVPMGLVDGLPVGLSIIGPQWADARVLGFGYAFEQKLGFTPQPTYQAHIHTTPALEDLEQPYFR